MDIFKYRLNKLIFFVNFLFERTPRVSFFEKLMLIIKFYYISNAVDCPHSNIEMLLFARTVFHISEKLGGVIVEAGSYKGGSTAKLSLIAKISGRKLVVFDSFQGLPENREVQTYTADIRAFHHYKKTTYVFPKGKYKGLLSEVRRNIHRYGSPELCFLKKGWFKNTMPKFHEKIAAVFLDVDLASSTRTCLKYLYPLLQPGGFLMSHDGHLTLVTEVFQNKDFWEKTVGFPKPPMFGLNKGKIISIIKPLYY